MPSHGDIQAIEMTDWPNPRSWMTMLDEHEKTLILALRADPDQQRHIVQYDAEGWGVTVRHPISERLLADDLFACPVLAFAEEALGGHPTGRYRLSTEGDDFERIED